MLVPTLDAHLPSRPESFLMLRAGSLRCALPLSQVKEVMRPLHVKAAEGLPAGVLGASVVRGEPLPVISLSVLLRQPGGNEARFVVVRTPGPDCVLAVDDVESIVSFEQSKWQSMPNLLRRIDAAEEIAAVDGDLVVTLETGRLLEMLPPAEEARHADTR